MAERPTAVAKVAEAAERLGLAITIREMTVPTRTAAEAAAACGVTVGQIVKSLVFVGANTGAGYLLLVAGNNRVAESGVAARLGEPLRRPDAATVRDLTGFAIGGIPPFGHATPLTTVMDPDLLAHDLVWAAAGTPNAVFSVAPAALRDAVGAPVLQVT